MTSRAPDPTRPDVDTVSAPDLSWRAKAAMGLFALHAVLLLLPPLPPYWKGSVWDYLLGYGAVALGVLAVAEAAPTLTARWSRLGRPRRAAWSFGAGVALLLAGWTILTVAPETFGRMSREEGLWEPLALFLYLSAAVVLLRTARAVPRAARAAPLGLFGTGFALLAAEELDYLGVFAPFLGRIHGFYVGSPHDLLQLLGEGRVPPLVTVVLAIPLLAAATFAWRRGYLRPSALRPLASPLRAAWIAGAAALLSLAMAEEVWPAGLRLARPSPEELLEGAAAVLLASLAIDLAAEGRNGEPSRSG